MFNFIFWICLFLSITITLYLVFINKNGNGNRYWLPGIWTAIGIGGTFWSLLNNIDNIDANTFKNPELMVQFIKDFASAFSTSLVGIIGSLAIKVIIKKFESNEFEKLNNNDPIFKSEQYFLDKIEKRLSELIQLQPTKENLIKWQSAVIEGIDDQKNGIVNKLGELESQQKDSFKTLQNIENNTQEVQKIFQRTAEDLVEKLHISLSPVLEAIGKSAFDKTEDMLINMDKQLSEKMGQMLGNLDTNLTASIEKLVKSLEVQTRDTNEKILKGIETLVETLNTQTEQTNKNLLEKISTLITSLESYFKGVKEQNESSLEGVKALLEYLKTKTDEQESKLVDINNKQNENYNNMISFYDEWHKNIEATNNQISKGYLENLDTVAEKWGNKVIELQSKYVYSFENIANDLTEKFISIKDILDKMTEWQKENKNFIDETTYNFDKSVTMFGEYMRETDNQTDKVKEFTEKINGLSLKVDKVIEEYSELAKSQKEHRDHTLSISKFLNEMSNLKELIDHLNKYK
jgi:hypothetical protein